MRVFRSTGINQCCCSFFLNLTVSRVIQLLRINLHRYPLVPYRPSGWKHMSFVMISIVITENPAVSVVFSDSSGLKMWTQNVEVDPKPASDASVPVQLGALKVGTAKGWTGTTRNWCRFHHIRSRTRKITGIPQNGLWNPWCLPWEIAWFGG